MEIANKYFGDDIRFQETTENSLLLYQESQEIETVLNAVLFFEENLIEYSKKQKNPPTAATISSLESNRKRLLKLKKDNLKKFKDIQAYQYGLININKNNIKNKLNKEKKYIEYKELVKNLRENETDRKTVRFELEELKESQTELQSKLGLLNDESQLNFVISDKMIKNAKEKLDILDTVNEKIKLQMIDKIMDENKVEMEDIIRITRIAYGERAREMRAFRNQLQEKYDLMTQISHLETFFDENFGSIVASVQNLRNGRKCFSTSQISYIIYSLVKMNAIIHEHNFLKFFLSNMEYQQSKEFMVFNYSIFTEETYVEGLLTLRSFYPSWINTV
jgi:hypothetical protein